MNNFEVYMKDYLNNLRNSKIKEAMEYSLFGDGKRFRPSLVFAVMDAYGLDKSLAYSSALALEMIHTYSLIHDDLPCMDDDDYRRGRLANHKVFGEDIATLAGDALLTESFRVITRDNNLDPLTKVKLIDVLSSMAGVEGMIHGQLLDMENENNPNITEDIIHEIDKYKTGCLFKCALLMPSIIAKDEDYKFYDKLGDQIGIIFQIQDDLFDIIKTSEETGKPQNSDLKNAKATAMSLYSVDEVKEKLEKAFNDTFEHINSKNFNPDSLNKILTKMKER